MSNDENYVRGKGAQINTSNPFLSQEYGNFEYTGIDEDAGIPKRVQFYEENPKKIINEVTSPDLGFTYSMNPYQGCEHGCVYCYARNTHHYWGYSAGLDFESKIIVKRNAVEMLEKQLRKKNWKPNPIMLSGNTDCYQPAERKLKLTRSLLEVLLKYRHPVAIITKNELILRDLDILGEMAKLDLVSASVSINSLNEQVRRKLEPRTSTYVKRMETVEKLSSAGIPVNVMVAPVIPGLTSEEIPEILKEASRRGARNASYTIVRLNGAVGKIFTDWVQKAFPNLAEKILHQVAACHGGNLNDSRFGKRMSGEGKVAESINQLFHVAKRRYFKEIEPFKHNTDLFINEHRAQQKLF